jgi:hypothetical protein
MPIHRFFSATCRTLFFLKISALERVGLKRAYQLPAREGYMTFFRSTSFVIAVSMSLATLFLACGNDAADQLGSGRGGPAGSSGGPGGPGDNGDGGPNGTNGGTPTEEGLFRALEPDMQKKCGGPCHTDGTYKPAPPTFLAPPDAYKSIKAHPGIVVADTYQSLILTKGAHAGPAVSPDTDPEFYAKVKAWLDAEALVLSSVAKPGIDATSVVNGANDLDLSKACATPLTGVHLTFDASIIAGMLELNNLSIVAPAGTDVHMLHPRFLLITGTGKDAKAIYDPADTFSNVDMTVPQAATTKLAPAEALFSGDGWRPFDFAADKIRIEFDKLEPGKVQVIATAPTCKNPTLFANNILPNMKGGGGFTPNCANCHGAGLAGMSLNNADMTLVCNQVLGKLNQANIAQSLIITKVTTGPHNGGTINNAAGWSQLFTNNSGAFF